MRKKVLRRATDEGVTYEEVRNPDKYLIVDGEVWEYSTTDNGNIVYRETSMVVVDEADVLDLSAFEDGHLIEAAPLLPPNGVEGTFSKVITSDGRVHDFKLEDSPKGILVVDEEE